MECFEVMRSFDLVRGAIKMMQPFDFRVSTYGAVVWVSSAFHCEISKHGKFRE
jgi:hypothetical protein